MWFVAGALLAFLVPFVLTSLLSLQRDLYYLVYFVIMGASLGAYAARMRVDVAGMLRRAWRWSLALGLIGAAAFVFVILREAGTAHPAGAYFAFELAWRGLVYGAVDALVLSAFPVWVAYELFGRELAGVARKLWYVVVSLCLVVVITAAYHSGYEQYRWAGLGSPVFGNVAISVPMIATLNPVGSMAWHATMHVTAAVHQFDAGVFLPPVRPHP